MSENNKKYAKTNVKNSSGKKPIKKSNDSVKSNNNSSKRYSKTVSKQQPKRNKQNTVSKPILPLKVISLGGLEEIGKNLTVFECGEDIILVDCGMSFPDEEMPGIDLVIPDFTYLIKNADRIRGLFVTHGHEDHIGAIPYLLNQISIPVYGTKLTIGLIAGKLKEHGLSDKMLKERSPVMLLKRDAFLLS